MKRLSETITTAPLSEVLTTVEACRKEITGIAANDTAATELLTELIGYASVHVREWLGYRLADTEYTEVVDLERPIQTLRLRNNALIGSIRTVKLLSGRGTVPPYGVWDGVGLIAEPGKIFPIGRYEVTYRSGYPTTASGVDAPEPIKRACTLLVAQAWLDRGRSSEITDESLSGVSSVSYTQERLPMRVMDILDHYRRVEV